MKIRTGFVSNSSSSSFVAVGIGKQYGKDNTKFNDIIKALLGCDPEDVTYETLEMYWSDYGSCVKDGITVYTSDAEPFFVGLNLLKGIEADKRLSEMKAELKQTIKDKLNINVPMKSMKFRTGTTHSG
jgi:hypothetical protein